MAAVIVKMSAAGSSTAGLLHYVYGPGKGEALGGTVHVNARTVAAWDGAPALHSPVPIPGRGRTGSGVSVKALARSMDDPVSAAIGTVPPKHVGHIIVANHPEDPVLSDRQWAEVAAATMANAGLSAGPDDPAGVRWIAVRHDDTSIHIVYTKAREDGTAAPKFINFTKAWQGMRGEFEHRWNLTPTGKADGTARRPYGQIEATRAKAARAAGDTTARPETAELRHLCRAVAAEAADVDTYLGRLADAGVMTAVDRDTAGQVASYQVGLSARPDGTPILYDATKLAAELAPEVLAARWAEAQAAGQPSSVQAPAIGEAPAVPAESVIDDAAGLMLRTAATRLSTLDDDEAADIAAATGDLLHSAAAVTGDDTLLRAAESYTRAGRLPGSDGSRLVAHEVHRDGAGDLARDLRGAASVLSALARLVPPDQRPDRHAARLILASAALTATVASWHTTNMRPGQYAAAAAARSVLHPKNAAGIAPSTAAAAGLTAGWQPSRLAPTSTQYAHPARNDTGRRR